MFPEAFNKINRIGNDWAEIKMHLKEKCLCVDF